MNLFTNIIIILFLTSCTAIWDPMPKSWNWGIKPRPAIGIRNFPSTDTDYGVGFKDGCSVAWNAITKGIIGDVNESVYDYGRMKKIAIIILAGGTDLNNALILMIGMSYNISRYK